MVTISKWRLASSKNNLFTMAIAGAALSTGNTSLQCGNTVTMPNQCKLSLAFIFKNINSRAHPTLEVGLRPRNTCPYSTAIAQYA